MHRCGVMCPGKQDPQRNDGGRLIAENYMPLHPTLQAQKQRIGVHFFGPRLNFPMAKPNASMNLKKRSITNFGAKIFSG